MWKLKRKDLDRPPWNKSRLVGQKLPLTQQQIWAVRMRLEAADRVRDLALFNLAIDSKLRACDLLKLKVADLANAGTIGARATVLQQKTGRPVRFELTPRTRPSTKAWVETAHLQGSDYLFPSRVRTSPHLSTRQYARIVNRWITGIGLEPGGYGTHTLRRTKATLIYRSTKNLRAVQLLLGTPSSIARSGTWGSKLTMHWKCRSNWTFSPRMATVR